VNVLFNLNYRRSGLSSEAGTNDIRTQMKTLTILAFALCAIPGRSGLQFQSSRDSIGADSIGPGYGMERRGGEARRGANVDHGLRSPGELVGTSDWIDDIPGFTESRRALESGDDWHVRSSKRRFGRWCLPIPIGSRMGLRSERMRPAAAAFKSLIGRDTVRRRCAHVKNDRS
jgi:hypothetical protein